MNDDSQFSDLKARLLSGEITPEEAPQVLAQLQADPELLEEVSASIAIDRLLGLALEPEEDAAAFPLEVVQRLQPKPAHDEFPKEVAKRLQRKPAAWRRLALPLAAAIAILGVLGWFVTRDNSLARVHATADIVWPVDNSYAIGDSIPRNATVSIESGVLELNLARRGHLVLEGPVELTVDDRKEFTLERGRVVVRVTRGGRGLTMHTPHGTIVDLGTSFAVEVTPDGSDVHVFEGSVRFEREGQSGTILRAGESLRSDSLGAVATIENAPDRFVRKLPVPGSSREPHLHWRFDEGSGTSVQPASSRSPFALSLQAADPGDAVPTWIDGPSGPALSFDGTGAFATTSFPGIEGTTHRTVALWVQVPENWTPADGGALVSWGRTEWQTAGALFELTLNTRSELGPIAAPQLDTFGHLATATDPINDGEWHHLAVTTFQTGKESSETHVLFYLDGRLLASRPRTLPRIDTVTGGTRHGVMVGRTIQSLGSASPPPEAFFRGSLDEVFIAPRALSSQQIKALMDGRPPTRP